MADAHDFKRERERAEGETPLKCMFKTRTMNVYCNVFAKAFHQGNPGSRDGEKDPTSKMTALQSLLLRT